MHQHPRRLARQQTPERDKEAAVSRPAGEDDVEDGDTSHRSRICSPPFLHQHNGGGLNYEDDARGVGAHGVLREVHFRRLQLSVNASLARQATSPSSRLVPTERKH